jgi:hypothetical protein
MPYPWTEEEHFLLGTLLGQFTKTRRDFNLMGRISFSSADNLNLLANRNTIKK